MKSEIITVSPEMAKQWLSKVKVNRKMRIKYVDFLSEEIKKGRFIYTGDPIRFDIEGYLIDGQHRLSAIIQSNIPVTLSVIEGLSPDSFYKIDTGISRSLSDTTGISQKLVEIYGVLLDVARGSATFRKSSNDLLMLHHHLGAIGLLILQNSYNRKFYASAPMKAATVLSIKTGQPKEFVLKLYRNLVTHQYSDIPPVAEVLTRRYEDASPRLFKGKVGRSSLRIERFLLGMYIYDENNSNRKKILLEDKREYYLGLCRHTVIEALSVDVPHLGAENPEKVKERLLKENIKLKEKLVQRREVQERPD